ncbi:MAG TPA: cytochrome P450 [Solirubrobacteraceae bacterium]
MSIINSCSLSIRLKRELPPSGPLPATLQTICCRWLPSAYLEQCRDRLGDRFTIYPLDMPPLVFLADPSDIRAVLSGDPSDLHPGSGGSMIAPLIGERSFMLLEEEEHICGRRTITPAFHHRMVADQTAMLSDTVEREVASWPLDANIALHPRIRALTLRVILRAIFSDRDGALQPLHEQLMDMLSVTVSIVLQEPKLRHLPGWRNTWRMFVKQRAKVDALIYELMRRRRAEADPQRGDLLDILLAAESPDGACMSDREIRDNLMSMILAGHETTTGELAWAFQLLAHNPSVQSRLSEEIDSGTDQAYLTATVNETLRHKPVFLFTIPREVIKPVEIGGWTYRPPVHLMGCTYLMHHNPELYPNPQQFRPERFIDETQQPRTWLPWGGGRKHCLGRHFALLEVQTILRAVLATRTVLPASKHIEQPRWRSAILVPHAGGRVILRKRRR